MLHDAGAGVGSVRVQARGARGACAAWLLAAVVTLPWGTAALAQARPTFQFRPDRLEKCDFFFVTEFSVSAIGTGSVEPMDDLLFTNSFGLMRNIDRSRAIGLALDAHVAKGFRLSPTVRFKQWLARRSSVDVTVGYAHAPFDEEGIVGWNGEARYYPAPWFHVRTGLCRIRDVHAIYYFPDPRVEQTTETRFHAGVGVGEVPGVAAWGGQVLLLAVFVAMFAGAS